MLIHHLNLPQTQELAEQPLKLSDMQHAILSARLSMLQQEKLGFTPDFSNEESIRKAIKEMAILDGSIQVLSSLLEDAEMQLLKEEDE